MQIERLETRTLLSAVVESEFDIVVRFGGDLTASQQDAFTAAEQRWEEIIVGDVRDFYVRGYGMVDDLLIDAGSLPIDGPGGVIGHARTEILRPGSFLPASGAMEFDSADLATLESRGELETAIFHEMGHVIGLGRRLWGYMDLLTGQGGDDPRFVGTQATSEYNALFGVDEAGVPVEGRPSGRGSADSHWRESVFGNEIMTPALGPGTTYPLSRVTIAALADMGYTVDMSRADAYSAVADSPIASDFDASTGRLTVSALQEVDIAIDAADGTVRILVDGDAGKTLETVDPADVRSLVVEGSRGDDRIDLGGVTTAAFGNLAGITVLGGDGDDTIIGSQLADVIAAGAGNDSVLGGDGDDTLGGEGGNDRLAGNGGNDLLAGGDGDDHLNGNAGKDSLLGGDGDDRLFGGRGRDFLAGEAGNDTLSGQGGRDTLNAADGLDIIRDASGLDVVDSQELDESFALLSDWVDSI